MAFRDIPTVRRFACDGCGATEETDGARPKYWSDLHILRDAYDYQGQAVADGSVRLNLCLACGEAAATALNITLDGRRAERAREGAQP